MERRRSSRLAIQKTISKPQLKRHQSSTASLREALSGMDTSDKTEAVTLADAGRRSSTVDARKSMAKFKEMEAAKPQRTGAYSLF